VPETLHALVAARLDGLEPEERTTLQLASVFGHAFPPAVVAALSGRPLDEVRLRLDALVAKQVLGYDEDPRSADRGQYRFLQGLLRTIAYGTLSRRDRKAAHLAAARHLQETAEAGELADMLASHFLEAARADPDAPDAPKIRAAARETLAEAGRRALSLALGREAQRAFDQAAELAEDDETRAELLEQAGRAAWLEADAPAARERLDAAIELHRRRGRPQAAARATLAIAEILYLTDDLAAAIETAEQAASGLVAEDADRGAAAALLGKLHAFRVDRERALEATEHALRIAEPLERWDILADALITRGTLLIMAGRPQEARALLSRGIDLATEHDLPAVAWRGLNNMSWHEQAADRLPAAREHAERALEMARSRGDRVWTRGIELLLVALGAEQGDWDGAERTADRLGGEVGDSLTIVSELYVALAVARRARGQFEALASLAEIVRDGLDAADPQSRECCRIAYALTLPERGRGAEALELLAPLLRDGVTPHRHLVLLAVLEIARDLGRDDLVAESIGYVRALPPAAATPTIRAHADHFAAHLAARDGDSAGAERLLGAAAAALSSSGRPFERAKVLLDHGELLADGGRDDEARALLAEARAGFEELGADPWIRRADRALMGAAA
jgi:tetratricopeptide (TPR) repeat protein